MSIEFICCECERHIVDVIKDAPPVPPLCLHCLWIPGWHEDPEFRRIFGLEAPRRTLLGRLLCALGFHSMERLGVITGAFDGAPSRCRRRCGLYNRRIP